MVVHAQASGPGPPALSRDQCRRIRAGHLQGPRGHAARSASPHRGLPDRRLRDGGEHLLHLHSRRIHPRARTARSRGAAGLRRKAHRQEQHPRLGFRHRRASRRRRLYLRRRDGAAGKPRRQERPAAAQAAVPGQYGPLWLPDHRQQCRDHRAGARHHAARRGVVRRHRPAEQQRHKALLHFRPRRAAVQCRREYGHSAARTDRSPRRRRARRLGQSDGRHSRRLVDAARFRPDPIRPTRC